MQLFLSKSCVMYVSSSATSITSQPDRQPVSGMSRQQLHFFCNLEKYTREKKVMEGKAHVLREKTKMALKN